MGDFRIFLSPTVFFFEQKTAYEMRISDWSSDVCSSDLYAMRVGLDIVQGQSVGFAVMIAIWAAPDRQFQTALRTPLRLSRQNSFRIIPKMPAPPAEVAVVTSTCSDIFKASAGQYPGPVTTTPPLSHTMLSKHNTP